MGSCWSRSLPPSANTWPRPPGRSPGVLADPPGLTWPLPPRCGERVDRRASSGTGRHPPRVPPPTQIALFGREQGARLPGWSARNVRRISRHGRDQRASRCATSLPECGRAEYALLVGSEFAAAEPSRTVSSGAACSTFLRVGPWRSLQVAVDGVDRALQARYRVIRNWPRRLGGGRAASSAVGALTWARISAGVFPASPMRSRVSPRAGSRCR